MRALALFVLCLAPGCSCDGSTATNRDLSGDPDLAVGGGDGGPDLAVVVAPDLAGPDLHGLDLYGVDLAQPTPDLSDPCAGGGCQTCGGDCLGGACVGGKCQAATVRPQQAE